MALVQQVPMAPHESERSSPRCSGITLACAGCRCNFVGIGTLCPDCKASAPDPLEQEVTTWVELVSGELRGDKTFSEWLSDGKVLCKVANTIRPRIVPHVNQSTMLFRRMENITAFIKACRDLGVLEKDTFSTVDLSEGKDLRAVMNCISCLGSVIRDTCRDYHGPYCGVAHMAVIEDGRRQEVSAVGVTGLRSDVQDQVCEVTGVGRASPRSPASSRSPAASPRSAAAPAAADVAPVASWAVPPAEAVAAPAVAPPAAAEPTESGAPLVATKPKPEDGNLEHEVTWWLEILGEEERGERCFHEWLEDGRLLCRAANVLTPGIIPKINNSKMPFKKMENISSFIKACRKMGVMEKDVFSTVDLAEQKNLLAVMLCVYNLGSVSRTTCPAFHGPYIGRAQHAHIHDDGKRKTMAPGEVAAGGLRRDVATDLRKAAYLPRHM